MTLVFRLRVGRNVPEADWCTHRVPHRNIKKQVKNKINGIYGVPIDAIHLLRKTMFASFCPTPYKKKKDVVGPPPPP